nr:protein DCL, chloroplastic [Tanacetum cinerariifolium]
MRTTTSFTIQSNCFYLLVNLKNSHKIFLISAISAFSAAISISEEEVIELDDSLRWAKVSQSLCSLVHTEKAIATAAVGTKVHTSTVDSPHPTTKPPSTPTTHVDKTASLLSTKQKQRKPKWEKSDQLNVGPRHLACLVHDILHSSRYKNGERLTSAEKMVVEKLLAYHPHSEEKIGCGIDYIMVDRHPHYRFARCLFVVRTDGGMIDFSYRKCIQAYKRSSS